MRMVKPVSKKETVSFLETRDRANLRFGWPSSRKCQLLATAPGQFRENANFSQLGPASFEKTPTSRNRARPASSVNRLERAGTAGRARGIARVHEFNLRVPEENEPGNSRRRAV